MAPMLLLVTVAAPAMRSQFALRPLRPAAAVVMCTPESLGAMEGPALEQQIAKLDEDIAAKDQEYLSVPDGPKRAEIRAGMSAEKAQLEADLAAAKAALEAKVGPPPKRYSAVGRMRQRMEGMGEPAGGDDELKMIDADQVLPPMSGLINIGITLAVVAAGALYITGGSS